MSCYYIDIQNATDEALPLSDEEITELASSALQNRKDRAELTIRMVPPLVIHELNHTYRKQNKPTNVLAFPCTLPEMIDLEYPLLGDIIICPQVVLEESKQLNKSLQEHWSLIIIHGVLHLLGYDHIKDEEAIEMQAIEIELLAKKGYANPYNIEDVKLE